MRLRGVVDFICGTPFFCGLLAAGAEGESINGCVGSFRAHPWTIYGWVVCRYHWTALVEISAALRRFRGNGYKKMSRYFSTLS